jgi:hypothetical protein
LVLVYSMRAVFLVARRGIESLLSAVDSRSVKYTPFYSADERQVVKGFLALFSILTEQRIETALYRCVSDAWKSFEKTYRSLFAFGFTCDLLINLGRGGEER